MQDTDTKKNYPEGIILLRILFKYYKQILFLVLLVTAGAVIFSSPAFIKPYYKAEVIFYPPGTNSNKILIEKDPRFGSDKEIEEQIQIIKSSIVRDSIVKKYDLVKHYEIDTSDTDWLYSFYKQLENNINVERTSYNSISVKVYDTSPVLAAKIANDIVKTGDAVKSSIIKANLRLAFNSVSSEYYSKSQEIDKIIETLNRFMETPLSLNVSERNKTYTERLKDQLDIQNAIEKARSGGHIKDLEALYNYQLKLQQLNEIQSSYFQAYTSLNSAIPSCYIITPAEVSYKKSGPKRLIIVGVSFFAALFFGSALAVTLEKLKEIRHMVTKN